MPAAARNSAAPRMSRQALFLSAALTAYAKPRLAKDQKMPDLRRLLNGVTDKTFKAKRPTIEAEFGKLLKPRLAQDASMQDFHDFLDGFSNGPAEGELAEEPGEVKNAEDPIKDAEPFEGEETPDEEMLESDTPAGKLMAYLQSVLTPEELAQAKAIAQGGQEQQQEAPPPDNGGQAPPPGKDQEPATPDDTQRRREEDNMDKPAPVTKTAMDAAITAAVKAERDRASALRDAERFVRPWIGDLQVAMDSADKVYKYALDQLSVSVDDVHPSAYRVILQMQPKPSDRQQPSIPNVVAMDAAARQEFDRRFPSFGRLKRA